MNSIMNTFMAMLQSGNPQQFAQNMIKQNPQSNAIFNQLKQSKMKPEDFTRQYAREHGINIDPYLQIMKNNNKQN